MNQTVDVESRWISRDPLSHAEMLQGPNLYEYVGNDPINVFDSFGTSWSGWLTGGVLVAGGVAAVVVASPLVATVVGVAAVGAGWSAVTRGDPATGALAGAAGAATSAVAGPITGGAVAGGLGSYMGAVESGQSNNVALGIGAVGLVGGGVLGNVSPWLQSYGTSDWIADILGLGASTVGGGALDLVTNLMNPPSSTDGNDKLTSEILGCD